MQQLQIANPLDIKDWDARILAFPEATVFHSSFWARVLIESYGFKPRYIVKFDGDRFVAVLPLMEVRDIIGRKKGVSLPFSDFCQPLFYDKAVFEKVFGFAVETARANKWCSLIIRGNASFTNDVPVSDFYYRHVLHLKRDERALFKTFRDSTQRNIKKAIKQNVTVTFESTYDAIKEFYRLNCLSRRSHGLPPQQFSFFDVFFKSIIEKGHGEVALAKYNGAIVSASVFLHFGKIVSYKYGASDARMRDARTNYLMMWEAIRRYNAAHYDTFCFGRTESEHKGLLQFKTGWGAEQQVINHYRYNVRKRTFVRSNLKTAGIFTIVIRLLPIPVLKIISSLVYKYMV
jgi:hypothetical protein